MTAVLMIEDHPVVSEGLKGILAGAGFAVNPAHSASEALKTLQQAVFDVILLDLCLPDINGFDLLRQLRSERPRIPVLVLSSYAENDQGIRTLRCGAAGYLEKSCDPATLISAVRKVARGGRYISSALAEQLPAGANNSDHALEDLLSIREHQVLRMLGEGRRVTDIATELAVSVKTVSTYRTRLLEKLELKNTAELIRFAVRHELHDLPTKTQSLRR